MMNRQDRAKQFMPFDALKGLQEELRKREERRSRIDKKILSDEMAEKLSADLLKLRKNARVRLVFYRNGHYRDMEGDVVEVNYTYHYIKMGNEKIFFDDIYEIITIEC